MSPLTHSDLAVHVSPRRPRVTHVVSTWQITELDFSRNKFDLAAIGLGEWLKTNKTITRLNLKNNDMHDKAMIAMAEALECNRTLTDVDLTCTFAGRETRYIAEALESNKALTRLIMDNCQIKDAEAQARSPRARSRRDHAEITPRSRRDHAEITPRRISSVSARRNHDLGHISRSCCSTRSRRVT